MDYPSIVRVLLVEDNPADVRLTRESLREAQVQIDLEVVGDGEEALAYLRRESPFRDAPPIDLVLLDLNLPRVSGLEVLREVRDDTALHRLPVIVLTTSSAEEDVVRSYDLHVNAFVTKPVAVEEFLKVVRSIEEFWLTVAKLPPRAVS